MEVVPAGGAGPARPVTLTTLYLAHQAPSTLAAADFSKALAASEPLHGLFP